MSENESKTEIVRSRFAPSPTGLLHLGGARTALFAFLFARVNQGIFIVRVEDTDRERSKKEYEQSILEDLRWLGLDWDEGLDKDGAFGPYRQSERSEIYQKYLQQLLNEGKAFHCFCSEEEIETYRQYQLSQGQPAVYSGKCRNLSAEEVEKNLHQGKPSILRFKNEAAAPVVFEDLIRGKIEFDPKLIGDFPIAKAIKTPLWNFSVTIDDFEMKITHVIRGEEHVSNTPKQILIQEALGFTRPKYAHLPMILAPDRSKLSKRHGSVPIQYYKQEGYLAESLINFVALLGWHPGEEKEIFSLRSLIKEFSLERVQKSAAIFNQQRLDWLNGFYLRGLSLESLTEKCLPYLISANLIKIAQEPTVQLMDLPTEEKWREKKYQIGESGEIVEFTYLTKIISLYQQRLKKLSEITDLTDFFFKEKLIYEPGLLRWKEMTAKQIGETLERLEKILDKIKIDDWQKEKLGEIILPESEKVGPEIQTDKKDRGYLLWPFRVALSGKEASAGPFEIAAVLGKEKTMARLKVAKNLIKKA
jgi:glutamyl-tRNA synthetase